MLLLITVLTLIGALVSALVYTRRNNPGCCDIDAMRLEAVSAYHRSRPL